MASDQQIKDAARQLSEKQRAFSVLQSQQQQLMYALVTADEEFKAAQQILLALANEPVPGK